MPASTSTPPAGSPSRPVPPPRCPPPQSRPAWSVTTPTAPSMPFVSPGSAAGRAPRRSRPTPTSTRSAPIPASWPCSKNSGRRGREGGPADTEAKFWSTPMRILVAIPHYFDAEGDSIGRLPSRLSFARPDHQGRGALGVYLGIEADVRRAASHDRYCHQARRRR